MIAAARFQAAAAPAPPKKKLRVATTSLAGCFGCHMSLLDIDERLFTLLEAVEFDRSPFTDLKTCGPPLAYHYARLIELLHAAEVIGELLHDEDGALLGDDLVTSGERTGEGVGILEAPRGTLIHHYRVDSQDLVTMCNLIVSTTHNNQPMNEAIRSVARQYLTGHEPSEGLLNHIEVAIRAFDPCLSCATHAMGQMPLYVEVLDARGALVGKRVRE